MGVSKSPEQFAHKMVVWKQRVAEAEKVGVTEAAKVTKEITLELVAAATGGDLHISGVKSKASPKGARVGARYRVRSFSDGVVGATVGATGPAQFIESDMPAHAVASKYAPRSFSAGARRQLKAAGVDKGLTRMARSMAAANSVSASGWGPRAVLHFGDRYARYVTKTGGSTGRHPYAIGLTRGAELAPQIIAKAQNKAARSVFG
jgi:hypothetical protein